MSFEYQFPDPRTADPDGLLAAGGDLSLQSLLTAYSHGIFPWYDDNSPILWWSPDPRLVLFPENFKISSSLRQTLRHGNFLIQCDQNFELVIEQCATTPRKGESGTWITREMKEAYVNLHREGFAHSFETYHNNRLVGGLYGVSLGSAFFGESMFFHTRDASKLALCGLVQFCLDHHFMFIDAQQSTTHLISMGSKEISRDAFLKILHQALQSHTLRGKWTFKRPGQELWLPEKNH
jgi:leucyl/phenylalanyl-tRNA--protein transferase